MAKGTIEVSSGHCSHCATRTKLERNSLVWGCGDLVMVVITCGFWALGKVLMREAWRCSVCGSKVKP
jgi:hypothetical protein